MPFQEFYCVPAGTNGASNLNAGDKTTSPVTTANGAYTRAAGAGGTDQFVAASGTPFASAVAGDYVSIYADGAAAPTTFIGRITAVNSSTSIDISLTAISGTRPATAASGVTATLGGAWLGPTGASGFPFGFIANTATDASGNFPRVNGVGTSNITAAIARSIAGPIMFQGYTNSPGDGGRWTIDGGTSGASYALLSVSQVDVSLADLILQRNGASGSAAGLVLASNFASCSRVVVNNVRGTGISVTGGGNYLAECEVYACNQSNTAGFAGFLCTASTGMFCIRCIAHDNTTSNTHGFRSNGSVDCVFIGCIADTNGNNGFDFNTSFSSVMVGCDAYNNGASGVELTNTASALFVFENCNFVKNGAGGTGYGINGSGAGSRFGRITNCGFGSGTQANTSGTTNGLSAIVESGSITYPADLTPWVDPANGDFRINLPAALGAGRGAFTQTASGYTGTVAYPDVGAAQSAPRPSMARVYGATMPERIPQSVALRVPLQAFLAADHLSAATGKTLAVTISKNGAAYGNPSGGATNATEIGSGSYYVDLSTTDTGTLGPLKVKASAATVDDVIVVYDVAKATNAGFNGVPDAEAGANGGLPILSSGGTTLAYTVNTVTTYTGNTPQTGDAFARLGAPVGASISADIAAVQTTVSNAYSQTVSISLRIGNFGGLGTSTVLGFLRAMIRNDVVATDDIGGTYDPATDSLQAEAVRSAAIKAKTDSLVFTVANTLDVNIQRVNDIQVDGTGTSGDPWGPV